MLSRFSSILISWCPDFQTSMIDDCCMKNVQSSLLLISQSEELWALRYTTSLVLGSLTLIFLPVLPTFLIKSKLYPFQFHEREKSKSPTQKPNFSKMSKIFCSYLSFFFVRTNVKFLWLERYWISISLPTKVSICKWSWRLTVEKWLLENHPPIKNRNKKVLSKFVYIYLFHLLRILASELFCNSLLNYPTTLKFCLKIKKVGNTA